MRRKMTRFQRAKVRVALEMMMPSIYAFIGSSPELDADAKAQLHMQFMSAFVRLDEAARAEI